MAWKLIQFHIMTIIAFTPGYEEQLSVDIFMYDTKTGRIFIVHLYLI